MEADLPRGRRFLQAMTAMRAGRTLPEVLREIAKGALDLTGGRFSALGILDRDGEQFTTLVHVGLDDHAAAAIGPDWSRDDVLAAPIQLKDKTVGYLYVAGDEFTPMRRQAVDAMALAAALAIRDYRQLEESRRREAWLRASNEITATLLGGQSDDELGLIAQHAREVAGAPMAAIALPDEEGELLVFEVVQGVENLAGTSIEIEGTASGHVFQTGQPILIDHYGDAAATWQGDNSGLLNRLGSAAIVPLPAGDEPLGVLLLVRLRHEPLFEQADLDLLRNFAAHVAMAVQYSRARADQQRLVVFEDRERIARGLHDLVIQRVFATGMALEAAATVIPTDPADAADRVRRAVEDLDMTIQEIRTTVFALQHQSFESLRSLVLATVDDANAALGFAPSLRFRGPVDTSVPREISEQLLPVLREALSNVARHAQATTASVEVALSGDLMLRITDNGVGIPAGGRRSGLANMSTRASQLGGTFTAESTKAGTELCWRVPLRQTPGA
ncbi:GAF domain-containing protein [Kibdelosporangium philippinense]|uniref:GAF domain-containing protein n=2 Tax=Kibdelosporangium philippinense TaxID=211113 RepID=A0ABS8ZVI7_9PSEU|nr:GAF domain-containing protein [Kibdelosporangium philippinense]MCE7011020.1 GAF domain-containing protein [Kibdelosporangium philippinense]